VVDARTDHRDIMTTVMRRLGVTPELPLAGRDLLADPIGPGQPWMALTSKAGFQEEDPEAISEYRTAIAEGAWKLHLDHRDGAVTARRLFDLSEDPGELRDLAAPHPEIVDRLSAPLEAAFATRRVIGPGVRSGAGDGEAPVWRTPAGSATVPFEAVAQGFRMEWTGAEAGDHVIQYEAGEGLLSLKGELDVRGTAREFGPIDQTYWKTFILPYGKVRLRVGLAGRSDRWSEWVVMTPVP
jgi:hypothetical protein